MIVVLIFLTKITYKSNDPGSINIYILSFLLYSIWSYCENVWSNCYKGNTSVNRSESIIYQICGRYLNPFKNELLLRGRRV